MVSDDVLVEYVFDIEMLMFFGNDGEEDRDVLSLVLLLVLVCVLERNEDNHCSTCIFRSLMMRLCCCHAFESENFDFGFCLEPFSVLPIEPCFGVICNCCISTIGMHKPVFESLNVKCEHKQTRGNKTQTVPTSVAKPRHFCWIEHCFHCFLSA